MTSARAMGGNRTIYMVKDHLEGECNALYRLRQLREDKSLIQALRCVRRTNRILSGNVAPLRLQPTPWVLGGSSSCSCVREKNLDQDSVGNQENERQGEECRERI